MKIESFRLLKKFMQMTLSGSEAETAFALKKANEIVKEAGTDWNHILDRCVKVEIEIESVERATNKEPAAEAARRAAIKKSIDDAFETVLAGDPRGEFADFIASLKAQWDRNGRLSGAQVHALMKSAERAGERR